MIDPTPLLEDGELTEIELATNHIPIFTKKQNNPLSSNNQEMRQMIELLGGMHVILDHSLSSDNPFKLSSNQLKEIKQIQSHLIDLKFKPKLKATPLNLNVNNNIYYKLFQTSRFLNIFKNKYYIIFTFILYLTLLLRLLVYRIINVHPNVAPYIAFIIQASAIIAALPIIFTQILSINNTVIQQVVRLFTFWFKLFYFFKLMICLFWYCRRSDAPISSLCMSGITFMMVIAISFIFAFIDGVRAKGKYMRYGLILAHLAVCWMVYFAISFTIAEGTIYDVDSARIVIIFERYKLDLIASCVESTRILAVFWLKQAICFVWKPQQAVLLKNDITINWIT